MVARTLIVPAARLGPVFAALLGCGPDAATNEPTAAPLAATPIAPPTPAPPASVTPTPTPTEPPPPRVVGCWEREFGTPPAAGATGPSLPGPIDGCEGCETLRVGPKAAGLHVEVLRRVGSIVAGLPAPAVDEPVMWINSGARTGDPDDSMHNQALAIDAVICGLDTRSTGEKLRAAGFTCVIEYYDAAGNPCHFAHGDLRATKFAAGAYAKGGRKARSCPKRATSRSMNCDNATKRDWTYSEG
jgi:hypothetical protein